MRVRLVSSRGLAISFVLLLGALVLGVLLGESARVPLRTPFVPREARIAPVSVALEGRPSPRGSVVFRLELEAPDAAALLVHEGLELVFDSPGSEPRILEARLELRGTGCAMESAGSTKPARYPTVLLGPSPGCGVSAPLSGPLAVDLEVVTRGTGTLSLLGFSAVPDREPAPLQVGPTRLRPDPIDVRGAIVDYAATAPRVVLLSQMWRLAPGVGWILGLAGLGLALACAGCLLFTAQPYASGVSAPGAFAFLRLSAGAGLLAGSLALLHAVLQPPLSGPDEPYHLLGYAELAKDPALAEDVVRWMAQTHLWRIRQQPGERFRTIDVGQPFVVPDEQLRATEVAMRSAVVAALWRALQPLLGGRHQAPLVLLAHRLVNAAVFAAAVAAAAVLAAALVAEPFPQWLVFPFLFVPSLPFFATHVSETAVLCSVYVLLGASLGVLALDGPRAHGAGLPLGLATALMLAGGRSPWPLLALVAAMLAVRALLGSAGARSRFRSALFFWGGFAAGLLALAALLDLPYRLMTQGYILNRQAFLPDSARASALWLLEHPAAAAVLGPLGATVEIALAGPREWLAARFARAARRAVSRAAPVLAALVVASLLGSLVVRYPQLPIDATYVLDTPQRLEATLATMATMFRLSQPNFLLASSFWVGFGWLDTIPGAFFQGVLIAFVGLALVALLRDVGARAQVRRFVWLVAVAVGAAAALVFFTTATQGQISTLVGRHLIGWYLAVLCVIAGSLTLDDPLRPDSSATRAPGSARAALLLAVAGAAHAYCLSFVLRLYF